MRVLVISNDVTPGFGVPVAAPGLRAAGLAEGLRSHGFDVSVSVPSGVLGALFPSGIPSPPAHTAVVDPRLLVDHIILGSFDVVIFINANMTPHLRPIPGVRFIFDMFAPKLLEALASTTPGRPWEEQALEKERGVALADEIWVNGKRKLGYALGWLLRPTVDQLRRDVLGLTSIIDQSLLERVRLVEMPVPLPEGVEIQSPTIHARGIIRLGIAGYSQQWSALSEVHPTHEVLVEAGHQLHALLPAHWGGPADQAPANHLPSSTIFHRGPVEFEPFARWIQSMDAMVDVFAPSPERHFAMITRSAVALRLGVPLLHGVDSEISDIVSEYDAGWVLDPTDLGAWSTAAEELNDPDILARKQRGARRASAERFAPSAALETAAIGLRNTVRHD